MNNYCMIQNSKTFAFSAENPTGVRAGGSQGGDCTKLRPTVTIPAGETVTLVDAAGPGGFSAENANVLEFWIIQ